ncbi:XRE family transcriptional regulator [Ligilactobacillus aviarius]|uniref:XRE family transcriptional regulator n=1 Tax=Ligilactobacillus aviarius TaxID=1606 RepID=UPI00249E68B8|nr:XRE family transcriptional regulator [Ligilactobacillus aviarius]
MAELTLENGRKKVMEWMQKNDVSYQDIATAFGYKNKQTVRDYITGDVDSTKANELVLRIISKFRIR